MQGGALSFFCHWQHRNKQDAWRRLRGMGTWEVQSVCIEKQVHDMMERCNAPDLALP